MPIMRNYTVGAFLTYTSDMNIVILTEEVWCLYESAVSLNYTSDLFN
jgi:hypothetical protein